MTPSHSSPAAGYHSPLRQAQAERTRDLILETFVELLQDLPAEDISRKELAGAAGVAERTVYRHYPNRQALRDALAERLEQLGAVDMAEMGDLDELVAHVPLVFQEFDDDLALHRAGVLAAADPRLLSAPTRARTERWSRLASESFPELSPPQSKALAAAMRMLVSSQTWLRLREEFGYDGDDAGRLTSWATGALLDAVRAGNTPPTPR